MKKVLAIATFVFASVGFAGVSHATPGDGAPLLCTFVIDEHPGGAVSGSASCLELSTLKQYTGPVSTPPYPQEEVGCPSPYLDFAVTLRDGHGFSGYYFGSWWNRVGIPATSTASGLVVGPLGLVSIPMIGTGSQQCSPGSYTGHHNVVGLFYPEPCGYSWC